MEFESSGKWGEWGGICVQRVEDVLAVYDQARARFSEDQVEASRGATKPQTDGSLPSARRGCEVLFQTISLPDVG